TDGGSGTEDFNWDEYLEETGTSSAPHSSFKHVETSLQSSFQPGMKLEVANKSNPDTYWVATIITTCGQLLLLRYSGYGDDRKADFWCDVMTADLHPVGWCTQNNKVLMPPEAIKEKHNDWTEFLIQDLTGSRTAPANLLEGPIRGKGNCDRTTTVLSLISMYYFENYFVKVWITYTEEKINKQIKIRKINLKKNGDHFKWRNMISFQLKRVGKAEENLYKLESFTEIHSLRSVAEWKSNMEKALVDAAKFPLPLEVFKDHADLRNHSFTVGMKLEVVDPRGSCSICPATVTKVFNSHYVMVSVDDLRPEPSENLMLCHADSLGILPVQWCLKNGVNLTPPMGYPSQDFDWADYQKQCGAEAAPQFCFRNTSFSRGFTKNMKLEAVNSRNPSEICVASITKVKGRLLWLHLEGLKNPYPDCIVDVESMDIFPVGWCETNGYSLTPPHKPLCKKKTLIAEITNEHIFPNTGFIVILQHNLGGFIYPESSGTANGKYSCPQIFINHRCFSGPYLNKGRIAELPQSVGPGKCVLVLKEVLSMLINAAYKPGRVLRELQLVEDPQWNFQEETLKAKYKGKTYRSIVKVVRMSDQVAAFCRKVCVKLQCCPNLFSPILVTDRCPENCSVHTKTKYTYYYGKRKKVIKPPIGDNNIETGLTKPARRRKKRKSIFVQKKRRSSTVDYAPAESAEESEEEEDQDAAEDETGSEETSSEQRDDHTDTSSAEVPTQRPKRAAALRRSTESNRPLPLERARRSRKTRAFSYCEEENYLPVKKACTKETKEEEEDNLILESNPLEWTVTDVVRFIKSTDCAPLAKIFQEQDIDGQALLLLTLPTVQECMELKLGPAIKLCHQIERVKVAFYAQYAN
uniref:Scm like with four mbt domains 2 n=1 Tax=Latimeria chalumnae TaxID=7897 RepID=H3B0Z2_LATCH